MDYKVNLMQSAEKDIDNFVAYLLLEKKSEQAAKNFLDAFERTKESLSHVAGSLRICENSRLKELGYRRINFLSHRYFMLYRVEGNNVFIDSIFHELQDYEKSFR